MTVTINESALQVLLRGAGGPVDRDMRRRAENVKQAAEQIIGSEFNVRTGNLLRSLRVVPAPTGGYTVICDPDVAPHAGYLEHGTDPHPIVAKNGRILVSAPDNPDPLRSPQRAVSHPGNRAFGFMERAREAARV